MRFLSLLVLVFAPLAALRPAEDPPKRLLYLTHSAGYKHDVLPLSEEILRQVGAKHGFTVTPTQDVSRLSREGLAGYDGVVFYTTGELPISEGQKSELMAWLKSGKAFIGIHSATDTFYKWPEYGEMIGGYFDEHPWNTQVTIRVEDRGHPSTQHLGKTWLIADEIYQFRNYSRDKVHVLMALDPSSVDMKAKGVKRTDGDFALAWHRPWGSGRMFYTALGHRPEVWRDPAFQQHLAGGIRWALRLP